ncbi:uncharacterized protein LOC129244112 [Anastrepha obliqua]|uniref:uncharacterized protein LOC129244112 n=1 Tax=Anastrepha obliqua TaxID=95512 RepID=UPI0024092761|nr:uncharacterized protein LOC129244112 [Anastrepha obliqua]
MQGIFLALLIGYAAAQSFQTPYQQQQQQQQQLWAQTQPAQRPMQNTPQTSQGQLQSPNTHTNYVDQQQTYTTANTATGSILSLTQHHNIPAKTNEVPQSLPGTSYAEPPQSSFVSLQFPAQQKQGQPLLQAQPHPLATRPPHSANRKPIWPNSSPGSSDGLKDRFKPQAAAAAAAAASNSHNDFNADLFYIIAGSLPQRNIVYSPISLQLLLAFVYTGASGQTAFQLQRALSLPATKQDTEKLFYNLLQTQLNAGSSQLVIANKMYHSQQLRVQADMLQRARYFESAIEATDFGSPYAAAANINDWVARKTQNIIQQLVTPNQLDAQTQAILVSAIHFKAKWANEFSTMDTEQQNFYVSPQVTVPVNMMYNDDIYRYGEFPELDAAGLEMRYANSNISMLVLLPNQLNGLPAMEQRLQNVNLNKLTSRMQMETVTVRIPRFRVDFELDMQGPLKKLGITDLFTDQAELKGFFRSQPVGVSQVQHKAFLDVNEAGSEAAAASFIKLIPLSLPNRIIHFTADHPFMFAIRSPQAVLFIGHVVNIHRIFVLQTIAAEAPALTAKVASDRFALKLSTALGVQLPAQNVVISPVLVQAILTLLSYGANDVEAATLRAALHLPQTETKQTATLNMSLLLSSVKRRAQHSARLLSAIYVQEHVMFKFQDEFLEMSKHFETPAEMVNFNRKTIDELNYQFLRQSNYSCGQVLNSKLAELDDRFVLATAAIFHAPWAVGFNVKETEKLNFFTDRVNHKLVDFMFVTHKFRYAELAHLDAKLVELPYANDTLKLWLLLPNKVDGLLELEERLQHEDLIKLNEQLSEHKMALTLPKFRVEYNADLKEALSALGLARIFNGETKFTHMFSSFFNTRSPAVSNMPHRAVWWVDETGGAIDGEFFLTALATLGSYLPASAATVGNQGETTERNLFAADIYQIIAVDHLGENVVISPAAIQTAMALAFYGAKGRTATEIQAGIRLGSANSDEVVRRFSAFQNAFTRSNNLRLFNKIYINENLEFKANFRDIARRSFDSDLETADFHPPYNKRTADRINKEVEQKTLNKVTNILQPQQLNDLTEGVMVNGIAYSAPWLNAFKAGKTERREFSSGGRRSVNVDMMWTVNNFRYGEVNELDAKVIELPYQNIEYSMLVLLPNQMNGLSSLVQRLLGKNLVGLVDSRLSSQKVEVRLPKFGFEFGVSLEQPFAKLGVSTMFSRQGDFGHMYRMFVSHYINSANHKAYVEVTEDGSVQSLESGGLKSFLTFSRPKSFEVDHPFVFAIKHEDSIIFIGHVTFNV